MKLIILFDERKNSYLDLQFFHVFNIVLTNSILNKFNNIIKLYTFLQSIKTLQFLLFSYIQAVLS